MYFQVYLPTAYAVRREGNVFTRVCPSIHPSVCPHRGGDPARCSRWGGGGGYPSQVQAGGTPARSRWEWGTWPGPGGGYPSQVQAGGTPPQVPPHQTWLGGTLMGGTPPWVPPIRPGWGVPQAGGASPWVPPHHQTWLGGYPTGGVPHLGYPPIRPAWGGTLMGGYPTE